MFSLVQFDDLEYRVLPSKRVTIIENNNCVVKYTGGAKYNAELIKISDDRKKLDKLIGSLKPDDENTSNLLIENLWAEDIPQIGFSTPEHQNPLVVNLEISNISHNNLTFNITSASSDPPSGFTDELNSLGPNWPNSRTFSISDPSESKEYEKKFDDSSQLTPENISTAVDIRWEENDNISAEFDVRPATHDNISTDVGANPAICNSASVVGDLNQPITELFQLPPGEPVINHSNEPVCELSEATYEDITENDTSYCPEQSLTNVSRDDIPTSSVQDTLSSSAVSNQEYPVNIQELTVPKAHAEKQVLKRHFCIFCKTLQTKFARHLTLKHKNEEDVKKFIHFPQKNPERLKLIDALRKKGDFIHNTAAEYNPGILIVPRQRMDKSKNTAEDYVCCASCRGYYSKVTLRMHASKCNQDHKKGTRNILTSGRRMIGYIHPCANNFLKKNVFPILNDDEVVRCIKYDELVILYGNKLCEIYTLCHQHDYIRAQLRMIGKIKLQMKKFTDICEFKEIFNPKYFDDTIKSLKLIAEWDENSGIFKVPFNVQFISMLIKKCGKKFRAECIKNQADTQKKLVEDFLLLWEEEAPTVVGRKGQKDQMDKRRKKKVVLPNKADIKLLYNYLRKECYICLEILQEGFEINAWKLLMQCSLVLVQIFNRRRAGEIERLSMTNYNNREVLRDAMDNDVYRRLSDTTKQYADQFTRLVIKGKLGRTVPVLLSPLTLTCIENILKFREKAGASNNDYIFSSTEKLAKPYLRACPLLRRFANECGAVMPETLRGTMLRKHIATYTAMMDIEENQVDRLANFMGHHKDVHRGIYRVPVPVAEITDVSKLLLAAIEDDDEDDVSDSVSDNEENNGDSSDDDVAANNYSPKRTDCSNSLTSDNETNSSSQSIPSTSKRYKVSERTKKPIKRIKWSHEEKETILKHFGDLHKLPKLPSLKECKNVADKYKILNKRTPLHIFSFINNARRRPL